jgi:hypothetical protein
MDKQQVSWLIVRAFGLYLLIQAAMLVPDLLVGFYASRAYSNFISSLGSDNNNFASTARQAQSMYRTLLFAPLLKFVLFSAAGMYLTRRGSLVIRLLHNVPDTPTVDGGGNPQEIVERFRVPTKAITCTHCHTDNTVTQCLECGRNFAVTTAHLAGSLRDFDSGPIANLTGAPPSRCDFCSHQLLGDTLAALEAGLRQRTCPACHTEFLSAHGL